MFSTLKYYNNKLGDILIEIIKTLYGVACISFFLYAVAATVYDYEPSFIEGVTQSEDIIFEMSSVYSMVSLGSWVVGAILFLVIPVRNLWLLSVPLVLSVAIGILNV